MFVERGADRNVPRRYRSYFQSCGELRDETRLRGPTIGRRVVPPGSGGLSSQWGRERPPSVSLRRPGPVPGVAHAPQSVPTSSRKSRRLIVDPLMTQG
jgi:hypothetical protein